MLFDEQVVKYQQFDNWFMTPQGSHVAAAFTSELTAISSQMRGENLLQLGSCGENSWFSTFKFRHKYVVTPGVIDQKTTLKASFLMLPLERDSIDCVIAPLTMESFSKNKNPIDEIDRILKPMGYVIFIGINPFSFWGASGYCQSLTCFGSTKITLMSSFALKHLMFLRGYRQCLLNSFYYIPPVNNLTLIKKLAFLNEMGKMIWPFPGGFYCLIMQKYQACTPSRLAAVNNELFVTSNTRLQANPSS